MRVVAEEAGVRAIDLDDDKLKIRFHDHPPIDPERILEMVTHDSGALSPSGMLTLPAPRRGENRIEFAAGLLRRMLGRPAA